MTPTPTDAPTPPYLASPSRAVVRRRRERRRAETKPAVKTTQSPYISTAPLTPRSPAWQPRQRHALDRQVLGRDSHPVNQPGCHSCHPWTAKLDPMPATVGSPPFKGPHSRQITAP